MSRWAIAAVLAFVAAVSTGARDGGRDGFTLRVVSAEDVDTLDPALASSHVSLPILGATCSKLYEAGVGAHPPRPEVAAGYPRVSRDGLTHTFTIRPGFRFSDGNPVTAAAYATAIGRVRTLGPRSPWSALTGDISRLRARGASLVIRLQEPAGDLVSRLAMPWACPVPRGLPPDPGGIGLIPGSGPYTVESHTVGRETVLRRNPYYRGARARQPDSIVVTIGGTAGSNAADVEAGRFDYVQYVWLLPAPPGALLEQLAERHGVNRERFFALPSLGTVYLALNVERPLFRGNPALRRAVNFALDRREIVRQGGFLRGRRTDRLLPPGIAGFTPQRLYPLDGPDIATARELASGQTRGGLAVLYTGDEPASLRRAAVIQRDLARIGLDVEIQSFPRPILAAKAARRGEPFDLVLTGWHAHYPDPAEFLVWLLDGALVPRDNVNLSYFQGASRKIAAAHRLPAPTRYGALARLEAEIVRDQAPVAALFNPHSYFLVSPRVGCLASAAFGPDYGSFCLR